MKIIKLRGGATTLVDDEDFDNLSKHIWSTLKGTHRKTIYAVRYEYDKEKKKLIAILMHRQIMGIKSPLMVNHENGDGLDNRKSNLRIATRAECQYGRKSNDNSPTGFKGVRLQDGRYRARLGKEGKLINLGYYDTPNEAAEAYNEAALKHYGEFARLNKIDS